MAKKKDFGIDDILNSNAHRDKNVPEDKAPLKNKSFQLDTNVNRRLKIASAILDTSERDIVTKALNEYLDKHNIN